MKKLLRYFLLTFGIQTCAYGAQMTELDVAKVLEIAGFHTKLVPIFTCLAKHESNYKPEAINKRNKNKTTDSGLLQVNSIWLKACKMTQKQLMNPTNNAKCALKIYEEQGLNAWVTFKKFKQRCMDFKIKDYKPVLTNTLIHNNREI